MKSSIQSKTTALLCRAIKPALPKSLFMENWGTALDVTSLKTSSQDANSQIAKLLSSDAPCLIGRLGSTEVSTLFQIERCQSSNLLSKTYEILRTGSLNIWNESNWNHIKTFSGFFPPDRHNLIRLYAEILRAVNDLDVIGSWVKGESKYTAGLANMVAVRLSDLEPYFHVNPWTMQLAEKKVLVIHPFARLIESQYNNSRTHIFDDPNILPAFELSVLTAVQTIAGQYDSRFANWFEALQWMENEAMKMNFDVVLVGCGAYGLPLAARLKRRGKKAIHLGGALQVLFGIKGARWDSRPEFTKLYNQSWVRPREEHRPLDYQLVEDGCYW